MDGRRLGDDADRLPPAGRALTYAGTICLGAGIAASLLVPRHPSTEIWVIFVVAGASFVALLAGVAALVSWRVLGDVCCAWYGTGLLSLGLLTFARIALQGATPVGIHAPLQPLDDIVVALVAGGLVWRAMRTHRRTARFGFLETLVTRVGSGLLAIGALYSLWAAGVLPLRGTGVVDEAATVLAPGIWLSIAAMTLWQQRARGWAAAWTAAVPGLLGVGSLLDTMEGPSAERLLTSSAVVFLAVSLAFGTEVSRLDASLSDEALQKRDLSRILRATQRRARRQHEQLEEWVHDVRNAVAGLRSVDAVLRSGYDRDLADRVALVNAVSAELTKLEALIEPARTAHPREVDLSAVVVPAATVERAAGATVDVHDVGIRVWADAQMLARVLQNVLVNARRYAPGSPVSIWALEHGGRVELRVRDRGPGLLPAERQSVFERGQRGASSQRTSGRGLGLYVARALLREMGGDLDVDADVSPGCCIRIVLLGADAGRRNATLEDARWHVPSDPLKPAV